jgi:hypothetical protein
VEQLLHFAKRMNGTEASRKELDKWGATLSNDLVEVRYQIYLNKVLNLKKKGL